MNSNVVAGAVLKQPRKTRGKNPIINENLNLGNLQENVTQKITSKKESAAARKDRKKHGVALKEKRKSKPSSEWRTDGSQESQERERRRVEAQLANYQQRGTVNPEWWGEPARDQGRDRSLEQRLDQIHQDFQQSHQPYQDQIVMVQG